MSEEIINGAPMAACPEDAAESGPVNMTQDDGAPDTNESAGEAEAQPCEATNSCATDSCDNETREKIRQRLDEIINREIEARMKVAEQKRQISESELLKEVLARPAVLRALAEIRAYEASSRASRIPPFSASSSASPATPRRSPRTLAEAREETEKLFRQGR